MEAAVRPNAAPPTLLSHPSPEIVPLLEGGNCQVWWARLGNLRPWHWILLNGVEKARAEAYRFQEDRTRFILGCAVSRLVLSAQLGISPELVPLDRTCSRCGRPHGRPQLPDGTGPRLSVTHSGDRVGVAFSATADVGLDVEWCRASLDVRPMAAGIVSEEEAAELEGLSPEGCRHIFYRIWTRKEALLKATGQGLSVPMDQVDLAEWAGGLYDLDAGPGYQAALAILDPAVFTVRELDASGILEREER
ncbi:4'-phosphopantetheinyl transferase family protein [Gorillibacterium sp. sgz5001074]|uniref:4'-phosphopantetheinyl transferase family protein n=1 Tax=Gorillibacterium sp. sgz5001074 TaxID=3446695 RepID=UPI003F679929